MVFPLIILRICLRIKPCQIFFAVQFYADHIKVLLLFVVAAAALKAMKSTIENDERTLTSTNRLPLVAVLITASILNEVLTG